jgi:hypothetical protein
MVETARSREASPVSLSNTATATIGRSGAGVRDVAHQPAPATVRNTSAVARRRAVGMERLSFVVRRSTFVVGGSTFVVLGSSFGVRGSRFSAFSALNGERRTPNVERPSSDAIGAMKQNPRFGSVWTKRGLSAESPSAARSWPMQ